jgi:hypothetical protein
MIEEEWMAQYGGAITLDEYDVSTLFRWNGMAFCCF